MVAIGQPSRDHWGPFLNLVYVVVFSCFLFGGYEGQSRSAGSVQGDDGALFWSVSVPFWVGSWAVSDFIRATVHMRGKPTRTRS